MINSGWSFSVSMLTVLIPSAILSACPGDELVVRCYEPETMYTNTRISLRWEITPINLTLSKIELPLSGTMNNTNRWEGELQFYAEFTSYSPLSAELITTAHPALNGARVLCASPISRNTTTIRVYQIPGNLNLHIAIIIGYIEINLISRSTWNSMA